MATFIDESGGVGLVSHGGWPYFRLAAVWVPTPVAADGFRTAVKTIRETQTLGLGYEFKYSETHSVPQRRAAFYAAALAHQFRFVVCCVDKIGQWRSASNADLYDATTMYLATTLRPVYRQAEAAAGRRVPEPVVVDDNTDPKFLAAVDYAFRGL